MLTASLKQLLPSSGDKVLAGSTAPVAALFKEGGSWGVVALGAGLHGGEGTGGGGVGKDLGEELLGLEERGIVVRVLQVQEGTLVRLRKN